MKKSAGKKTRKTAKKRSGAGKRRKPIMRHSKEG
jgi:hypothetical protein